jgi:hypothetical protein
MELKKYLGAAFAAVGTADELDVATAVLVATTLGTQCRCSICCLLLLHTNKYVVFIFE